MTSKLVVNTIEADTGISSVSFASSISMSSTSKFHFSDAGIDIGADTNISRPANGVLGFNINGAEKVRIDSNGHIHGVGVVTATHFYGDGSNLTGLPAGTTINGNTNNYVVTATGTANTLQGESTLTFDGTQLRVNAGAGSNVQSDGSGSYGQFAGVKVWMGAGSRSHNTAVGNGALASASGGDDCTAIGHNAYANGTTGEDNTAIGSHCMVGTVTGSRNAGLGGHGALNKLTSGYDNTGLWKTCWT
ncbi:MAG: hypothetical protein CM15mL4_0500 [uncultured marine virus]|nr:MAG: hypothetical protein CM15mL4_0500 [uncultured marine virus]